VRGNLEKLTAVGEEKSPGDSLKDNGERLEDVIEPALPAEL
jgi:hypothetical protein